MENSKKETFKNLAKKYRPEIYENFEENIERKNVYVIIDKKMATNQNKEKAIEQFNGCIEITFAANDYCAKRMFQQAMSRLSDNEKDDYSIVKIGVLRNLILRTQITKIADGNDFKNESKNNEKNSI